MKQTLCFLECVLSLSILTGCLASTNHFRKGKLLKSGVSEVNWGFSYTEFQTCLQATIDVAVGWRFPIPTAGNKRVRTWYEKKIGFVLRD